jgi:acyl carrier protein
VPSCRSTAAWRWASDPPGSTAVATVATEQHNETDQGDVVSNDETFEKFKGCAVEVLQVPEDKITRDARFAEDLDADSLDLVELVMALEETFDVSVDETELEGIETIGQAYDLIVAKL